MTNIGLAAELEERLQQWAEWCLNGNQTNMGFPKQTIEGQLMTMGAIIRVPGSKHQYIPENQIAESMERYIKKLFNWDYRLAIAIRARYLGEICLVIEVTDDNNQSGVRHELRMMNRLIRQANIEETAKALKISVRALENRLARAKNFLAGHIYDESICLRRAA